MPRKQPPESALYVRIPKTAIDKLHRAAEALGVHKKDLVANLVGKYVDPDSQHGRTALGALAQPRRVMADGSDAGPTVGGYSFQAYDSPEVIEVMGPAEVARFLQLDEAQVIEAAEAGTLPGRKLGSAWRFSRTAIVAWLAG